MNGFGFTSISSAANFAIAGDTIEVVGTVDPNSGLPVAYTNGNGEVFPILLASGVDLIPAGSNPVYIWPTGGANPTAIIDIVGTTSPTETRILQMSVLGGQVGISVNGTGVSDSTNVVLQKVTFGRSVIDLTAIATNGATVDLVMNDCKISNIAIPLAENPGSLRSTAIGLQFHAVEGSGIPKLNAVINNLTARGTFAFLSKAPLIGGIDADIERVSGQQFSRLVEVFSTGLTLNAGETGIPETDINVSINGGILEGGPGLAAAGWDIGIYSMALSQDPGTDAFNYRTNSLVTITGTTVSNFVEAGVYATAGKDVRSRIVVQGQSSISGTGSLQTHAQGDYFHSGIHLFARLGYLGLTVADSKIEDNTGNGITLRCAGTDQRSFSLAYPMGMPLSISRSEIHGNGGDGIELQVGVGSPLQPSSTRGIVGGTRVADTGFTRLDVGSMSATTPFGQGVIDQTSISNNGEHGIRAYTNGDLEFYVFCRVTNCFIWNNPLGGFVGEITSNGGTGSLLTPILHCTFVGNGSGLPTPYNIEINEPIGLSGNYFFDPEVNGDIVGMEIFNCIFNLQNASQDDFGPNLESIVVDASSLGYYGEGFPPGQGLGMDRVAVGGVRFSTSNIFLQPPFSNNNTVSFDGPLVLTNRKAKQFFLSASPANNGIINDTPTWQTVVAPETDFDFEGEARPNTSGGLRDKGGDEQ